MKTALLIVFVIFVLFLFNKCESSCDETYRGVIKEIVSCVNYNREFIKCSVIFEGGKGGTVGGMVYIGEEIIEKKCGFGWKK